MKFDIEVCDRNGAGEITQRNRFNNVDEKTVVEMILKWDIQKDVNVFYANNGLLTDNMPVIHYSYPAFDNARKQAQIMFLGELNHRIKNGGLNHESSTSQSPYTKDNNGRT